MEKPTFLDFVVMAVVTLAFLMMIQMTVSSMKTEAQLIDVIANCAKE